MPRVYLTSLGDDYLSPIEAGLKWVGIESRLRGANVWIKPNLTYPMYRKGVMTNPSAVEALIQILRNYTTRITICEADSGGYNRFSMTEVFNTIGLTTIARKYEVKIVNMSLLEPRVINLKVGRNSLAIPLPAQLLDEMDMFVSIPVPKIHMNTGVSVSIKNQWGVIQQPSARLRLHPYFKHVIHAVNRELRNPVSIVDGKYGLTRSGPMEGDAVDLNWLMVSDNIYAGDLACCLLMKIDPSKVHYLRHILTEEGIARRGQITFNTDIDRFVVDQPFYLKRAWTDYPGLLAFKYRTLAYLGYESPLAGLLHWILYRFREPFYDYSNKESHN